MAEIISIVVLLCCRQFISFAFTAHIFADCGVSCYVFFYWHRTVWSADRLWLSCCKSTDLLVFILPNRFSTC